MTNRNSGVRQSVFVPLALGRVKPKGWLAGVLKVQADGLTGHLDDFWPDVAQSGWIRGEAEGWERAPYWLDGLVPLAYLLEDPRLLGKMNKWIDYILEHQQADGWLGPVQCGTGKYKPYDPWPVFVALKALWQYYGATGDARVPKAALRFFRRLDALLDEQPLFSWGEMRWADLVLTVFALYEHTGEEWLLRLADKVQVQGYDWRAHFLSFAYTGRVEPGGTSLKTHVVNNAMGIKAPGVWYLRSGDPMDRQAAYHALTVLDRYHGQPTGVFSGDEHLAGRNPSQGTELCAVVELMFTLEVLSSIFGDPAFADRLELVAFNALPGTITPDMWAHQYDQQVNQVRCTRGQHIWTTNGQDSNIYGLEPNYGCCTANMHQGWPKFASHMWMATPEGGVAAVTYGPAEVTADLPTGRVHLDCDTSYPFAGRIRIVVHPERGVASFPLLLRVPGWADDTEIVHPEGRLQPERGTFARLERTWRSGDVVEVQLPLYLKGEHWFNNSLVVRRGPIVFSLRVGEEFRQVRRFGPAPDYEVLPTTPWNYALAVDPKRLEDDIQVQSSAITGNPFDPKRPPLLLKATGRLVPDWGLAEGFEDAAAPPPSPILPEEVGPAAEVDLVPYGATHLRITEFPYLLPQ